MARTLNPTRNQTPWIALAAVVPCIVAGPLLGAESAAVDALAAGHGRVVPLVKQYCQDCHAGDLIEGEVDLSGVGSLDAVRSQVKVWQRVAEMVSTRQMPPPEADQPTDKERAEIGQWLHDFLKAEARSRAGDPGRVVLRRLNNAEDTYTIRVLPGVDSLVPAKEFPADCGEGEGFTNTGQSLVMSPALVTKYFDAAKAVAGHAVLLPDGFRFSAGDTRRDWADEALARIRGFYGRFTQPLDAAAAAQTVLGQGIRLDLGHKGFLPTEKYLLATLAERDRLAKGGDAIAEVARERGLSPKYLATLWATLTASAEPSTSGVASAREPSLILDSLRARWKTATPGDAAALAASVAGWQKAVWKFNNVGQIARQFGRPDGPPSWMEAVTPLMDRQEFRVKLAVPEGKDAVTIRLTTGDAGDGRAQDFAVWENPRLVVPGRADLPLRLVRHMAATLATQRERLAATASKFLAAGAEAASLEPAVTTDTFKATVADLSRKHAVDPQLLSGWLSYLGIGAAEPQFAKLLDKKLERFEGWAAVNGWGGDGALRVIANSSDEHPGAMKPHGVAVHPEVKQRVIVGWRSPISAAVQITGGIEGVHVDCSNGTLWSLQVWRGATRQVLASGTSNAGQPTPIGPFDSIELRRGDVVSVVVGARDGNHICDLTAVDLAIRSGDREWDLAKDVSADILAANPHADRHGHEKVWHFASEPDAPDTGWTIPAGSLLARWMSATAGEERGKLTTELEQLLADGGVDVAKDSPDAALRRMLLSATGPLLARIELQEEPEENAEAVASETGEVGIDSKLFGRPPEGLPTNDPVDAKDLCVQAPFSIDITIPAELAAGCELVTAGKVHPQTGDDASVQLQASVGPGADSVSSGLSPSVPVVARKDSAAWKRFEASFTEFRSLFPKAVCYARIVPVDEVVTLNLYYREDDQLRRLMLSDAEAKELDRLWEELLFIAQEPLEFEDAFEQFNEYAGQIGGDGVDPLVSLKPAVAAYAEAFRREIVDAEPLQLAKLQAFAAHAYRRPLRPEETRELNEL